MEATPHASSVRIHSWRAGREAHASDVKAIAQLVSAKGSRTWIDLTDPTPDLIGSVALQLGLHPLIAEDIAESNERAKVQLVGDVIHVVSFVFSGGSGGVVDKERDEIRAHEIDFVLGRGFLLSSHPSIWDPAKTLQLRMGVGPLLARGPDFVLWALIDAIVDSYFPVFDRLGDEIDDVQDATIARPEPDTLQHVFMLKRELIRIRHVLAPTREVFAQLTSREFDLIAEQNVFYFRDVYDHLIRLNDELDTFRDLVASAMEVYLSSINNNLSTIMKRLTGVTVILAGIGAIAGLFGMSEAGLAIGGGENTGFWLILLVTLLGGAVAALFLRRIDWL